MTRLAEPRPKCCSSHTNGHFDSALPSWSLMTMIAIIVMILKKIMTPAELSVLFRSKLSNFSGEMAQLSIASLPRSVSSLKPERVTQYSPRYLLLIRCQIRFVGRFFRLSISHTGWAWRYIGCAPLLQHSGSHTATPTYKTASLKRLDAFLSPLIQHTIMLCGNAQQCFADLVLYKAHCWVDKQILKIIENNWHSTMRIAQCKMNCIVPSAQYI